MSEELIWRLRGTMRFDVVGACYKLAKDRPNASCNQVGIREVANPDRAIEALCDEVNEAVGVRCMDVELRVPSCHVGKDGGEVSRPEGKRHGNS